MGSVNSYPGLYLFKYSMLTLFKCCLLFLAGAKAIAHGLASNAVVKKLEMKGNNFGLLLDLSPWSTYANRCYFPAHGVGS